MSRLCIRNSEDGRFANKVACPDCPDRQLGIPIKLCSSSWNVVANHYDELAKTADSMTVMHDILAVVWFSTLTRDLYLHPDLTLIVRESETNPNQVLLRRIMRVKGAECTSKRPKDNFRHVDSFINELEPTSESSR